MKLKANYDRERSWSGRQWYDLENGCSICVEYNNHYGDLVKIIHYSVDGDWYANNGLDSLPECFAWAKEWIEPIAEGHWKRVMRPDIEVIYE